MAAAGIDYHDKKFVGIQNVDSGEVSGDTIFHYRQEGDLVWATYAGGSVRYGQLVATVDAAGRLDMRYQHVNTTGELKTGCCQSTPELLPDGRLRLHERWQWTCDDCSEGHSIVEEIGQ